MKEKLIRIFLALCAPVMLAACQSARDRLVSEIEALDAECPCNLGFNTEITSIVLEGSEAVITTTINVPDFDVENIRSSMPDIKGSMIEALKGDPSFGELAALCRESDTTLRFTFVNHDQTRSIDITIPPADL